MTSEKSEVESILAALPNRRRTPVSTYRVQLHKGFGFSEARGIIPYLSALGISDFYSSPILQASPGSLHGYDICNHNALNPELGSTDDYEGLIEDLRAHDMGYLLDFVPNHMGIDPDTNPWWHDVLENGQGSRYARFFDIHWNPIKPELKGKVLLPVLGGPYGVVLEQGEIRLSFDGARFSIAYYDHHFPVNPKQYPQILRYRLDALQTELQDAAERREFLSIITEFDNLPASTETSPERVDEREREKFVAQDRLKRLVKASPVVRQHIDRVITYFNGQPGQPDSFNALHTLLEAQAYRLAYWKTAFHEINYRRFFDINSLAGLRVENENVFPSTHHLVMEHIAAGKITGLRIDHPDGLYDPAVYFEQLQDLFLQEWVRNALQSAHPDAFPDRELPAPYQEAVRAWRTAERKRDPQGLAARPLYVVAEKILSQGEALDSHWVIDGTSGYDYLNAVNGLFINPENAARLRDIYMRFTGKRIPFETVAYVCKKLIMSTSLASELNVLAHALEEIAERDRRSRDYTLDSLRDALKEVVACFPVYRTYMNASRAGAADRAIVERATQQARGRNPALEPSIFDFVRWVLTPGNVGEVSDRDFRRQLGFTMKFQQYTGPVQAKGLEDTAFYRYNVLLSLNEVGSDPTLFGTTPARFHELNLQRQKEWRYAMLATATHDTKRGEDMRMRLNVLSEIPDEWEATVNRWSELNLLSRTPVGNESAPDWNDEYHFYQILLGTWSGENRMSDAALDHLTRRIQEYMLKAVKEAKLRTSWVSPNEAYENGITEFVNRVLRGEGSAAFWPAFEPFARRVARLGMLNSLSQVVLKIASPGVPDFYQGSELWNLSLVDPDNRVAVDFENRQVLMQELQPLLEETLQNAGVQRRRVHERVLVGHGIQEHTFDRPDRSSEQSTRDVQGLLNHWENGAIKMFLTAVGLHLRQDNPALFLEGEYNPLETTGESANQVVAFLRRYEDQVILAVVPRGVVSLTATGGWPVGRQVWRGTALRIPPDIAGRTFRHVFVSEEVSSASDMGGPYLAVADLLNTFPIGLYRAL
jgi:(1->4)-alpha-D-glucan 1-alpha-D-glucosylmutase